jgi:hypothetical protein
MAGGNFYSCSLQWYGFLLDGHHCSIFSGGAGVPTYIRVCERVCLREIERERTFPFSSHSNLKTDVACISKLSGTLTMMTKCKGWRAELTLLLLFVDKHNMLKNFWYYIPFVGSIPDGVNYSTDQSYYMSEVDSTPNENNLICELIV